MRKVYYQRWGRGQMQDIPTSIEVLDGYNKTRYSRRKKDKDESLLEEAARYAYDNNKLHFVTIYESEKPYCYLEINKGFYRINFLDEHLRTYMSYTFMGKDDIADWRKDYDNKLFLETVTFWEFADCTDKIVKVTNYHFKPDGSFAIVERDSITHEQITSDAKNKINVTANWEEYPDFGNYDSIIRKERGLEDG